MEESIAALNRTEEALANANMLTYPKANAFLGVTIDASRLAMSTILRQLIIDT